MKKAIKAIIAVIMSLVLVFSITSSAFATETEGCDCGKTPVVFVEGIGTTLYIMEDGGERKTVFPMSTDVILISLAKFIPAVLISSVFGGWSGFSKSLSVFVCDLFSEIDCDENGNSVLPVVAHPPVDAEAAEHIYGENIYTFRYDWRLDPYVIAAELDEYIDSVIAATGHDKVVLSAYSEGGEVTLAYLDEFGSDKLERYVAQCSAFQGLTLIGEVFTNNVGVKGKVLADFLVSVVSSTGADDGVVTLLDILRYTGVYSLLSLLVDSVLDNCFDDIYATLARDVFACMPGIFGFVPAEYFDKAVDMLFGHDKAKYAALIERVTRYHNAQVNAESIIEKAIDNGVSVAFVSNYGVGSMPLLGDKIYQSDMLIDSANTAGGATFAPFGKTFGDGYNQAENDGHNHLSPDGCVDASTCMFPEYTWFVSGFTHWNVCEEFINWLYWCEGQPTVWDNPAYPQFLEGKVETGEVIPQK